MPPTPMRKVPKVELTRAAPVKDGLETCDLRFRSPKRSLGWATWSAISSGFREIEVC